ncbi:hypothetical protein [endosymbiont GvMRE of Glomus versiforme]|uniref:hypothetical protein n=1 Tax=endosymbiont GvMRE of Glomus versiforme TaxID=2039283 RepID=UPI000ED40DC5|nr:hypothetical protein [endosymbiont GvMRE of Glomus versiforme]RHZ36947.1 hypothetical protein GvMRE_I2g39 [endosymbiont GvMRE of Glomus versiforme]
MTKTDIKFTVKEVSRRGDDRFLFSSTDPIEIKGTRIENPIIFIQISEAMTERRFQVFKEGDVITLLGVDEGKVKIVGIENDSIDIGSRALYDEITVSSSNPNQQDKVLSWINGPDGFLLCAAFNHENMRLEFINSLDGEAIGINEVDPNNILDELEKFIRQRRREFHLNEYKHQNIDNGGEDFNGFNRGGRWQESWWNYDREIKYVERNTLHPAIFLNEERYQRIYDLLVNNLSAEEYVRIDDNDESKNYENGAPAYFRRQKWTGHKRTPYKDSPEWEKGMPKEKIEKRHRTVVVVNPQSIAEHNQNVVEEYNNAYSSEIRRINALFVEYWNRINEQRENLPSSKQKLLAKIERKSQQKLIQDEEITVFTELQELTLLNPNAEAEQIIQQAEQNFRQIELNQILYEAKWRLIWLMAQLFNEEKPVAPEQEQTKELSLPEPEKEIETEEEPESEDNEEKIKDDDKIAEKNVPEKPLINTNVKVKEKEDNLLEAKKNVQQKIKELLKKHSLVDQDLPQEYQNWYEQIQKLNSEQELNQFLQQMEEVMNKKAQSLNQNSLSPQENSKNYHLLFLGLGAIVLCLGGLIILLVSPLRKKKD